MNRLKFHLFAICIMLNFTGFYSKEFTKENYMDTNNVIIQFDPYVSILDQFNRSRYGIPELLPLISKVASRFTKFYVEIEYHYRRDSSSLLLSPYAIAKYNCLNTTKTKVEVYLGVTNINCNCENLSQVRQSLANYLNQVNNECNGTVTTIFLQTYLLDECKSSPLRCSPRVNNSFSFKIGSLENYNWGLLTRFRKYCNETTFLYKDYPLDVIAVKYLSEQDLLKKDFTKCKFSSKNSFHRAKLIKKYSILDTNPDNIVNMKGFVETWKNVLSDKENMYIIAKAFDSPFFYKFNGWWYLVNDTGSTNTSEFIFHEKIEVASQIDAQEDPKNFEWLKKDKKFNKNSTGITFSGLMNRQILSRDFCRVLALQGGYSVKNLLYTITGLEFKVKCGSNWQIVFLRRELDKRVSISLVTLKGTNSVVLINVVINSKSLNECIKSRNELKTLGVQYGYAFHMEICEKYANYNDTIKPYIYNILGDTDSITYMFRFQENSESTKAGATRMFRRKSVLFHECRKMVLNNRNHSTEIAFALIKYFKMKEFYKSPWALQNYVKYIDLLSDWAEQHANTIVYIGTDLDTTKQKKINYQSVGWYSHDHNYSRFITKRQEALELSISHYAQSTFDTGLSIVVAIVSLIVVISVFVTAFYFVRNYYKTTTITNDEIHKFINGNDKESDDEIYNTPYDKLKYEIPEGYFTINNNGVLGSGEFGKVCRGTISTVDSEISVAVKTTNPLKFHKTTVHCLLSEIKVLAYLGLHKNITELLGANIAKLRHGRVYIFLELCELGSLETYLRDIAVGRDGIHDIVDANTLTVKLYEDLYRWSLEICNGMSYLVEKHVVHADLATRNVLLNQNTEAKLCDFGLSRRMLNYTNYVKTGQEPLPWKWMAPESLTNNQFSEKSDVWAFGVTLWEIYSLGDVPYPGLSWDVNFPLKLEKGFHLPEPKYNEKNMYDLMKKCWNIIPHNRLSFAQIQYFLETRRGGGPNDYATVLI